MARVIQSDVIQRGQWPVGGDAGEVKVQRAIIALDATAIVATDVIEAVVLPANHVPVDIRFDCDDLDSNVSPALTIDFGIITGAVGDTTFANRTVGTELGNNLTTAQAAALYSTLTAAFNRMVAQPVDRAIGFKVEAAPGTAVVRNGTLTTLKRWTPGETYVANDYVILPNGVYMQCTTGGVSGVYGQTETLAPSQAQPNWNLVFAGTTADGTVTWTCRSPIIRVQFSYAPALNGF